MPQADITRLRELQQKIRQLMPDSSEGEIEAAIRLEIGCSGPVELPPERKMPPAPQYPEFVFIDYARRPKISLQEYGPF